jgi:lysozyme family protein
MANYKLILPSVAKFEGGLSSDPKDSCSKLRSDVIDPKNGLGYHTNKGVCYSTWVSASKKLGFDSSGKAFVNMTQSQWESIIKELYWNPLNLDKVNSQAIAEILFQSNWGSGMGGAMTLVRFMQGKLNLAQTGKMDTNTITKLNDYTKTKTSETSLFKAIWQRRLEYLQSLKSFSTYGKGWTNRMNDLLNRGLSYIDANKSKLGIGALLLVAGGIYFAYTKNLIRL